VVCAAPCCQPNLAHVRRPRPDYGLGFQVEVLKKSCSLFAFDFWLLALGSWLLAIGFSLLALGFSLLALGSWLLALGSWCLALGSWLFVLGSWFWLLAFRSWLFALGSSLFAVRSSLGSGPGEWQRGGTALWSSSGRSIQRSLGLGV
jgi:hypothetical protein